MTINWPGCAGCHIHTHLVSMLKMSGTLHLVLICSYGVDGDNLPFGVCVSVVVVVVVVVGGFFFFFFFFFSPPSHSR
jgi:hypothetical protein